MIPHSIQAYAPNSDQHQPDLESLLKQALIGDNHARNQLLEALLPRFRNQVNHWLNVACRDAQSDILQSVIRRILTSSFPSTLPQFRAWVGAIIRNRCHDEWRRNLKQPASLFFPAEIAGSDDEKDRRALVMWGALELLSDRDRHILEQTFYDGRSSKEIGDGMDLSPGAVRILRHRALKKLGALLENPHDNQ
jgi:RNA polymerase sigma factor (sigma-70 family)